MLGAELKQETGHTKKKKHYFEIDCVGANIKWETKTLKESNNLT